MTRPFPVVPLAIGLFLAASASALAQPLGYYEGIDATSSAALRQTLHEVIDDHVSFMWDATRADTYTVLEEADRDPDSESFILDLYRNAVYPIGAHRSYHREHTWPSSYGFPLNKKDAKGRQLPRGTHSYPYTDCHHLFLADAGYNMSRSNRPFGTCDIGHDSVSPPSPYCEERPTEGRHGRGGGSGEYPGWSNWKSSSTHPDGELWETWMGRRGDVARAQFYMDVRYEGGRNAKGHWEPNLILTNQPQLIRSDTSKNKTKAYMGYLTELLVWHFEDPVDQRERRRNNVVARFQGNRNPFVDHPEWVDCLYLGDCSLAIFKNGFEAGDASAWSGERGQCEVVEPGLNGTSRALAVALGGGQRSFVVSRHPARESSIRIRFFLDLNGIDLDDGEAEILRVAGNGHHLRLMLSQDGPNFSVRLYARQAKGGYLLVGRTGVPARREVELAVEWRRASEQEVADGVAKLFKNGAQAAAHNSLANHSFVANNVWLGLPRGAPVGGAGELLFDEYRSNALGEAE